MRNSKASYDNIGVKSQFGNAVAPVKTKQKYPRITLRLTSDELTQLQHLSSGISVSAYIRKCVFGANVAPRKVRSRIPIKDQEALAQILGMLGQSRIANNLNQIAYQANCGSLLLDDATEDEINIACAYIAFMRVKLIEALGLKNTDQQ